LKIAVVSFVAKERSMQVRLKVLSGSHEGKEIAVKQDKFLIGRSESCHLRPKSESVSRKHCILVIKDGKLLALDLKSRNGTFVNDKQLTPEKAKILKHGDKLKVGHLDFEVVIEVGLGGAKRPEVKDMKEAAERAVGSSSTSTDSRYEELDINSWLEEADQIDRSTDGNPETRQFVLDDAAKIEGTLSDSADETSLDPKKEEKEGPGKMKFDNKPKSANSRDAASQTLKRYFGGR
jgi:pSer/pThr/pTyr-binding forkhead associated (FHA) protein